jgi:RNA ligase (TIGR02306 family)
MQRKLVSVQQITEILPIEGADKIVCVKILGWQCVALKTEFNLNDRCVFFEIDSVLPIAQWNAHLRKELEKKLRVKTIRLRGTLSQGLALPVSLLPDGDYEVGQDVTQLVGVEKYEPYIPAHLAGISRGNFPSFLHKTDETRLQSVPEVLQEAIDKRLLLVGTLKMDGTSFTSYLRDGEFGVCSRNLNLKETEDNAHWKLARKLKLEEILRSEGKNICVQGEMVGPGIQANRLGLSEIDLYLFNLYDIDTGKYAGYNELVAFGEKHGLKVVKNVYRLDFGGVVGPRDVNHLLGIANGLNYDNGTPAEGIVWRPLEETYSDTLKGRMSFKTISNRYLEKYKE